MKVDEHIVVAAKWGYYCWFTFLAFSSLGIFHGVNYDIIVCINGNQNNLCILVCLNNTEWMLVGVKCKKVLKKCAGYITIILLSSNKTKTLYKIQKRKFIDY